MRDADGAGGREPASDWEQPEERGWLGRRGRAVVVVLLLGAAGGLLVAQALPSDSDGDGLVVDSDGDGLVVDADADAEEPPGGEDSPEADDPFDDEPPDQAAEHWPSDGEPPEPIAETTAGEGPESWLTLLLSSDVGFTTIELATDHRERLRAPELSGGDPPFRLTRRGHAVVFYGAAGDTYAAHPAALDEPWRIGRSDYYLPSAESDRVWLVDGVTDPAADARVREVTADGETTHDWVEIPEGAWPRAAVDSGIVFEADGGLRVWDPTTREDVARLDGRSLAATGGDLVAWCDDPCEELRVTEASSGKEVSVEAPTQGFVWDLRHAAFSPEADALAAALTPAEEDLRAGRGQTGMGLLQIRPGRVADDQDFAADVEVIFLADVEVSGPPVWARGGWALVAPAADGRLLTHERGSGRWAAVPADLATHYGMVTVEGSLPGSLGDRPAGPLAADGLVVSVSQPMPNRVQAVDPADGAVRWTWRSADAAVLGPVTDGAVLVASATQVVALELDSGEERWSVPLDGTEHAGAPAVADEVVYLPTSFGVHDDRPPRVYAIDVASGAVRWESTTGVADSALQWAPPLVTDSRVLVVDTPSHTSATGVAGLHGFDRETGEHVLERPLDTEAREAFHADPLVLDGDHVLATTADATLHRVDWRTGEVAWRHSFETQPRHLEIDADGVQLRVGTKPVRLDRGTGERLDP